jgi:hypothetical protein
MTKLTMWDDLPTSDSKEITAQLLSNPNSVIFDLGDVVGHLKENMPPTEFEKMWDGVEMLLVVLTEQFGHNKCEVKMIVSEVTK